jgi:hypothetical protein
MTVSKVLLSAVIALTLVPAAAQAASNASAQALSPAARSLSLSSSVRVGAKSGKTSHVLGLGLLASLLIAGAAVAATVVVADAVSNNSSG